MRRILPILSFSLPLLLLLLIPNTVYARGIVQGYAVQGNGTALSSLAGATLKVQKSYPGATVTVYPTRSVTPVSSSLVYSNTAGTVKGNPFTADNNGYWFCYLDDGAYDFKFSGGGITIPFLLTAVQIGNGTVTVSVKSFGAVGDGNADDHDPIQNTINFTCTNRGTVYFPATTASYKIASGLTLATSCAGITLAGQGVWSTINNQSVSDMFTLGDGVNPITGLIFTDLNLSSAVTAGWGINGTFANNIIVKNCSISTPGGIHLINSIVARITNNTFGSIRNTPGYAVFLSGCHASVVRDNRIDGTTGQNTTVAVYAQNVKTTISGNVIESFGTGVDVWGVGTSIIGNYFESNVTNDVLANHAAAPANGLIIQGNVFASTNAVANEIDYADAVYVDSNRSNVNYSTSFVRFGSSTRSVNYGATTIPLNDGNPVGGAHAYNANGPVTSSFLQRAVSTVVLLGDLTTTRTLFRVRALSSSSIYRLRYYLEADSTSTGGGKSQTYGGVVWTAQMSTGGAWAINSAAVNEFGVADTVQNGASAVTVVQTNGDNTGALIRVACTNYNGAFARGTFSLEVISDGATPVVTTQ